MVTVKLEDFKDQQKRTVDLPLAGLLANATQATGTIKIALLWLHDLPLLLRQHQEFVARRRRASLRRQSGSVLDTPLAADPLQAVSFSKVMVELREARDIIWPEVRPPLHSLRSCFCRLELSASSADSEGVAVPSQTPEDDDEDSELAIDSPERRRVAWGMNFTFEVEPPSSQHAESLRVSLICSAVLRLSDHMEVREMCLGVVTVPLSTLVDQRRHTGWYPLHAVGQEDEMGSVNLSLLWLHDLAKLVEHQTISPSK
jgi:hypothetical protein